jgi:hypothetical protein
MVVTPCFVTEKPGNLIDCGGRHVTLLAAPAERWAAPGFEQPSRSNALRLISIYTCLFLEPGPHIERVYADAKQVCWNKAKL